MFDFLQINVNVNAKSLFGLAFATAMLFGNACAVGQNDLPDEQTLVQELDNTLDEDNLEIGEIADPEEKGMYKYAPNPDRVRLKSLISDAIASRFKQGQPITIRVPADSKAVSWIVIQKPQSFKSQVLSIRPNTIVNGRQLTVELLPGLMDRLDYQPIRLDVFQSDIESIRLVPSDKDVLGDSIEPVRQKVIAAEFYVRLKPDNGVAVAFTDLNSFRLSNDIIDMDFPFSQIEAIFIDEEDAGKASIILRNGDNISGQHGWPDKVEFETPWGNEQIELNQVVSVTRNRSVSLVPSGVASPKWVLIRQR